MLHWKSSSAGSRKKVKADGLSIAGEMGASCFVVMGYGRRTDHATGRLIDLDKTYRFLIKPVMKELGLVCVRGDEIRHSGTIDVELYQALLTSDVVIADLSTANPNALYELGIRHALRPRTTIVIAERELPYPFDLSHTLITRYVHLGDAIDVEEAERFREELKQTLLEVLARPKNDSPVYTYLPKLVPPLLPADRLATPLASSVENLETILEKAQAALDRSDFRTARERFAAAIDIDSSNPYLIQQLALSTYKAGEPDAGTALMEARDIIGRLRPSVSTDPETLGIAAAIEKRLHEQTHDPLFLESAIVHVARGFHIKQDYYNGINYAYLLDLRASIAADELEAIADRVWAGRVRGRVLSICEEIIGSDEFERRDDRYWVLSTMAEAAVGMGQEEASAVYLEKALSLSPPDWQRSSALSQIERVRSLQKKGT